MICDFKLKQDVFSEKKILNLVLVDTLIGKCVLELVVVFSPEKSSMCCEIIITSSKCAQS